MRHVMVLNAKGGCGKSTLATNIAVFFARDPGFGLFADDIVAQLDAFVADEHGRSRDQLAHFMLRFAAKTAI